VIAVGAFIEVYLATILSGATYVAKVPGDIVWERARNTGYTKLGIGDFQNAKLSIKYKLFRCLFSLSLRRATSVIVPSVGLKKLCLKWGVDPNKIKVIYNSVDTNFFVPGSVELQSFDIVTACRLTTWKKVDELITLAAKMGLRLGIAGDGPEKANLQSLAQELDANVVFFGDLPREDLLRLFHDSRFFVLNSEYEGLPHVLIEARSSGVVSLARSGTGSSEVIHDKHDGYTYSNLESLFQVMNHLVNNPKSVNQMKDLARQDTLLRFNKDRNFVQILEVIRES
jgi:glycosyltransferase involved in cell wall biosynthesis